NKYDPLAEVMTDKVNAEVPSSFSGKVVELIANEGDTLEVGAIICTIEVEGDNRSTRESVVSKPAATEGAPKTEGIDAPNKARYSPAVLKLS
ncbi:hypothetical protein LAM21_22475, partial [Mycobacterium tuberculosis]|nr:hypothetical protein [Mycobacterium tuberculosis]